MPDLDCFNQSGDVSSHNERHNRWPRRRTIHSCQAAKGPLFTRYYLFESKPLSIYIHCFHTSDDDRAFHDHPWSFLTFLFHRGYWEITPEGVFYRPRFSLLYRPATWQHIVLLKDNVPTWTLMFRFRRVREWGFILPTGWMNWRDYGKEWCD